MSVYKILKVELNLACFMICLVCAWTSYCTALKDKYLIFCAVSNKNCEYVQYNMFYTGISNYHINGNNVNV